jgi:hypothetical protein
MSASNQTKLTRQARLGLIIQGIQKNFSTMPSIDLGGTSFTPASLSALLQKGIDAITKSADSRAQWLADVHRERDTLAAIAPVVRLVRSFVVAKFGETEASAPKLEEFGFTPRKVKTKTVKTKAAAAEQAVVTRQVRHTMGKRQKAKVKGTVAAPQTSGQAAAPEPAGNPPTAAPKPTA